MLVLVTNRQDLTADWLVAELNTRDASFLRLNTEDYPTSIELDWAPDFGTLCVADRVVHAHEVRAVWWRRPLAPRLPASYTNQEAAWASGEAHAAIEGFWRSLHAHWVNPPSANAAADCKPEQLRRAARLGFEIPATIVTNQPATLRAFSSEHRAVVCKPLREGVVPHDGEQKIFYTEVLGAAELAAVDELGPEPYLFQSLVRKRYDLRITVIGNSALACKIDSQSEPAARVDWRKGDAQGLTHTTYRLPAQIAEMCVKLAHSYGLRFAAIDLARRTDGGYTFFELNPNGQWAWIEQLTGLPLRTRLADELLRPEKVLGHDR